MTEHHRCTALGSPGTHLAYTPTDSRTMCTRERSSESPSGDVCIWCSRFAALEGTTCRWPLGARSDATAASVYRCVNGEWVEIARNPDHPDHLLRDAIARLRAPDG